MIKNICLNRLIVFPDFIFAKKLRIKLELHDLTVWIDSRNLRGGDQLAPEIEQAIKDARQVIVVLSPATINSAWIKKEVKLAEQIASDKSDSKKDYRVTPLMLPGIEPPELIMWFKEEPAGIKIRMETGQLQEKLPEILTALGERLPDDAEPPKAITAKPIAELLLELSRPELTHKEDGSFQLSCEAELEYIPADPTQPQVKSKRFAFKSPIGHIEQRDLRWYLEEYFKWTTTYDQDRAKVIEAEFPQCGKELYQQIIDNKASREVVNGWQQVRETTESIFSIRIDAEILGGEAEEKQAQQENAYAAASKLLSLPWGNRSHPLRLNRKKPVLVSPVIQA